MNFKMNLINKSCMQQKCQSKHLKNEKNISNTIHFFKKCNF